MVAPLFALSLLWERLGERTRGRIFRPRSVTYRIGPLERTLSASALASGILLALMGAATLAIGLTTDGMPAAGGWQAELSAKLQHYGSVLTDALSGLPGWTAALLLVAGVALLARRAMREQLSPLGDSSPERALDLHQPDSDHSPTAAGIKAVE